MTGGRRPLLEPMGTVAVMDGDTGPIRSRARRVRVVPYSRDVPIEGGREVGSLLSKVKDIVGWLLPSWFSPKKRRLSQDIPPREREEEEEEREQEQEQEQDIGHNQEQPMEEELTIEDSRAIFRRLTMERESRMRLATFADLATYFRQQGDALLTKEEYESLALVIQRMAVQEGTRTRRAFAVPGSVRRSPRFARQLMATPRTVERAVEAGLSREVTEAEPSSREIIPSARKTIESMPSFSREVAAPTRRARVFSARFDDLEEVRPAERMNSIPNTPRIAENRLKLIEEARLRVAEQIRLSQQQPVL